MVGKIFQTVVGMVSGFISCILGQNLCCHNISYHGDNWISQYKLSIDSYQVSINMACLDGDIKSCFRKKMSFLSVINKYPKSA